jgi:hypothetical protein
MNFLKNYLFHDLEKNFLPEKIFTTRSKLKIILFLTAPSILISYIFIIFGKRIMHPIQSQWPLENYIIKTLFGYLDIIVFGPLIETALLFLPIMILQRFLSHPVSVAILSSVLWGYVHFQTASLSTGMLAIWPFFCMSLMVLNSTPPNRTKIWLHVSLIHGMANLTMVIAIHVSLLIWPLQ